MTEPASDADLQRANETISAWQNQPRTALQDLLISQLRTLRTQVASHGATLIQEQTRIAELQATNDRRREQLRELCDALGEPSI